MSSDAKLKKHLSPAAVWAFSIGSSVGWGSLVVTSSTYLAQAGPLGSVLGLVIGTLIMLVVARCYAYMMKCYPEAGGTYSFVREVFGYDLGYLAAWFTIMTYLAVLWANATSLPLFGRIFLGGLFSFGKLYTIFGYDVYLGEVLLSMSALAIFGFLCTRSAKMVSRLMVGLAALFCAGVGIAFAASLFGHHVSVSPLFIPDVSALRQIIGITIISPWAFIGFESISHYSEEFSFKTDRIHRILIIGVVSTALLYLLIIALSVSAYPPQFSGWLDYIRNLDSLSGIEALPAFYAANAHLGSLGVYLLMLSLLALVFTSLLGLITALSRLFYALAGDEVLPPQLSEMNSKNVPANAVWAVVLPSLLVPLIGRTAIGWIVDITTIGALLIYGFVTLSTARMARNMEDRTEMWMGRIGFVITLILGASFLMPNLVSKGTLANETYFLFIIWTAFAFISFRLLLRTDTRHRFGNSVSVWIALLVLMLVVALIWMRQSMLASYNGTLSNLNSFYTSAEYASLSPEQESRYILTQMNELEEANTRTMIMAIAMFGFALVIMLTNHNYMDKRTQESEKIANRDSMTGVLNKHAFIQKEKEMDRDILARTHKEFAIVVCDVNGLKKINDTLGHKAGDEYIRKSCTMVCDIFRHSPVFRVGGDEFVAILTGRDFAIRRELMEALHDRSVDNIEKEGEAVISGGLSDYDPACDESTHDVFQRADAAMYEEKKNLKSLGAAVRDDESDDGSLLERLKPEEQIIKVRRHILIAEDEPINQELLGMILENDYDILYADNGAEAMNQMREHKDELALLMLDLNMPIMNGIDVLKTIKEEPELASIPVIVLTADQEAEYECLNLGAMDFIPKPYPIPEVVKARVDKCIELTENRDLIHSTERDSLTKLFNIDYFMSYVKKFDQHYEDMPMDAIVIDVNHFHMLNERYGKQYGDIVLRRIGETIRAIARKIGGVGCRQSADTFLLYCPAQDSYDEILNRISGGLSSDEHASSRVRLRLGVYRNVDKSLDIERRYDRAKIASDNVKNNYASAIGIYSDEMGETALYHERLVEDFPKSLEHHQFLVYFQPKFDIRPQKPVLASAEALVRWRHPELGMIPPGVFIPVLEENGLILQLDEYVWRETARVIRFWKDKFGFSIPVSVNVSRIDMLNPNLKSTFREILEANRLTPDDLILEITESAYTGDSEQVISTACQLRGEDMGFRIEMDDFGTGYSSLGMLGNLPIDVLKLDMTFIRSAFGETRDVRMIELIIDIADYLHVPVVAEGVETEEQYLTLKAMGCDLVQGYYFSKPVPREDFDHFLAERGKDSVEITPAVRKTSMSLSRALTKDFDRIFYIDTLTRYYLEFRLSPSGEMDIQPFEKDFFLQTVPEILKDVPESERAVLSSRLSQENVMKWSHSGDAQPIRFHCTKDGSQTACHIQPLRTRASDSRHVMIGIGPDSQDA